MEELKPLTEIYDPDERNIWRNYKLEHLHAIASEFKLNPSVPENVRFQFEVARHAYVYCYFYQPLSSAAELYSILAVELALRIKFEASPRSTAQKNDPGLRKLLETAVEEGWIVDAGFDIEHIERVLTEDGIEDRTLPPERARKNTDIILEFLPERRNSLAHGSPTLTIEIVSTSLQRAAEIINQLFPAE